MKFYIVGRQGRVSRKAKVPYATLTPDTWNDFGFVTLFTLKYLTTGKVVELGPVKISSAKQHKKTNLDEEFEQLADDHFSLGQSIDYYRAIRKLPKKTREEILVALRDVVFQPNLYEQFSSLDVFSTSLTRYSEASVVLRDAGSLFKPTAPKTTSKCSFLFRVKMQGASSPHELSVELGNQPLLPDRVMALIGKNGTGKTWLLGRLAAALSGDEVNVGKFLPSRPAFRRVIAMSYSAFDRFNKPKTKRTFSYIYCGIYDAEGKLLDRRRLLKKSKDAAAKVAELKRIELWTNMIDSVLDTKVMEDIRNYLYPRNHNSQSPSPRLSSGQLVLLSTITELVASIENDSIVLFDEPELHQHPNSVAGLLLSLSGLLREFDSFAIVATHSPLVIQQIPSQYVRLFIRTKDLTTVRELVRECFGENLTAITQEIFQTNASPSLYHDWFKDAASELTDDEIVALFQRGLSFNALSALESVKD
ncbi:AAA family ATPase [Novipirellula rosea]|uniref:AAA family ATPase n=1 Tax=Novipirellula rosea TaxID=1031540 RepID=A0ABP8MMH9_9BACT